jgi:hypothetical protein
VSGIQWIKKNFSKKEIILAIAGAVIPITAITILFISQSNINSREQKLRELWKTKIVDRYKLRQSNEPALKLQELSSVLGINLVPSGLKGVRPSQESMNQLKELNKQILVYLRTELSKEDTSIEPLPEQVLEFYDRKKLSIDKIITYLNENPEPEWVMDVSNVVAPWPNLPGHFYLQRLLTLDALCAIQKKNQPRVESTFRAMLHLNHALLKRPEFLSQRSSWSIMRYQLGIIRKWTWERNNDVAELLSGNYAPGFYNGMFMDKIGFSIHILEDKDFKAFYPSWYLKLVAVDLAETNLQRLKIIQSIKTCSEIPAEINSIKFARWNSFAKYTVPENDDWASYVQTLEHLDLTRRIVELRIMRQKLGRWPQTLPPTDITNCTNAIFNYQVNDSDSAVISITNVPLPSDEDRSLLSRQYRLSGNNLIQ